ncbi:MAG: tyrosine-type recombinase/integrase [Candidatus Neomicrothrix subdominans]
MAGEREAMDLFEHYQRDRRHLSEWTIQVRRHVLNTAHRHVELFRATTEDLEQALDERHLQPGTRADYAGHLNVFYRWALKYELTTFNPAAELERPRRPKRLPRPVREDQLTRVLAHLAGEPRLRCWVILGAYAGLRRAEIAGLCHENVDILGGSLRVRGKGRKDRVVPMHPLVTEALIGFVATNGHGRIWPVTPEWVGQRVARSMREAGVSATSHQLRHRFGTALYDRTGDLAVAAELMGHASMDTTRIYAAVGHERRRAAVVGL